MAMPEPIAAGVFSVDDYPDHVVLGVAVVPGGAVLDLVLDAARRVGAASVGELRITRTLVVPDGGARWQLLAGELAADGSRAIQFCLRRDNGWVIHAVGELIDDPTVDGRDGFVGMADWPVRGLADATRRDGLVPVRWRDVEVLPTAVRSHVVWDGDRGQVWLADDDGRPAGYVDEVVVAPLDVDAIRAEPVAHVYRVDYREVAPTVRDSPGGRVVVDLTGGDEPVRTTLAALARAGDAARELVFLIDDSLACAPVRGLARSLQAECPERTVRLVEVRADASPAAVAAALDAEEPELVVAGSVLLAPQLMPVALAGGRAVLDQDGTALVTGGTGELGRLMARHLVVGHGIRHLVLVSRRGVDAPGAADLVAELEAAGASSVQVLAADVGDRAQVAEMLAAVDPRHPLTAVLHLAGVVDPRLVTGQDNARFSRVLVPKVDGAWHLHELTRDLPLAAFVLFSSVASVFGSAGQSNYAAANAYLDALATHRRASGLVATSVSWGSWARRGLSSYLGDAEVERLRRQGVTALTARQGRRIFDAAIAQDAPHLVAAVLTAPATVAAEPLASLPDEDRWRVAVDLVRREVAVVLGATVGPRQVLSDAGVDSLMALELQARLTAVTAVPLPATLVMDHPTAHAIARLIVARLAPAVPSAPTIGVVGAAAGALGSKTVWAALEHAGIVPESLRGKRVGVFVGAPSGDVAGQVAEQFRLLGPAVTVCGSPLVAVHLARMSLLREECEVALAGGDGVLVLRRSCGSDRAVVDSAMEGVGGGQMADLVAAVVDRRWAEVPGRGARVTVEPCVVGSRGDDVAWPRACGAPNPGAAVRVVREAGASDESTTRLPLVVSGRDMRGLRRQAARWAEWLDAHPDASLADVAFTAALRRTHFAARACVFAGSVGRLVAGLRALADGVAHPDVVHGVAQRKERVVFECSDHNGRCVAPRLLKGNPTFARAAADCDRQLRPVLGWSVVDALMGDNALDLDHPDVARPALITVQVSLAAALRDLGFTADDAFGTVAADVIAGRCELVHAVSEPRRVRTTVGELDEVVQLPGEPMEIVGAAHVHGYAVHWGAALPPGRLVDLPASSA
jgi:NADP-dependent 3-hydroxy acid dehydrogenase YdfG